MEEYGRRLMPHVLHEKARHDPNQVFASVARSEKIEDGFGTVTYQQVSRAVNFVAFWLLEHFPQLARYETITYIGVSDLRYNILFYAAVQSRLKVFLPMPRNTTAVNASLLVQTQCSKLVFSPELQLVAQSLKDAVPILETIELPSLETLLDSPASAVTYDLAYKDVYHEPILVLHSSGSTGPPKPVVSTHGSFATCDIRDWPTVEGRSNHDIYSTMHTKEGENYLYSAFPPFHLVGYYNQLMSPLYTDTIPILGPAMRPPTGALAADILRIHRPRMAFLPPSLTEQLTREPDGIDLLRSLDMFLYAGGPLSDEIGAEVSNHAKVRQFYGTTEMGQMRQLAPAPEDWAYFEFHPSERFEMQPHGDGLFELVKFPDERSELYYNFPGVQELHTKDLFRPHPTKPRLWKFATRTDDIIVFSTGENLNPLPMEMVLTTCPGVQGALVVGRGRGRAALLLELDPKHPIGPDPRGDLWPAVEKGNSLLPPHGRVARIMIIIANPEKPLLRASKGTVIRRRTEDIYDFEIQNLYENGQPNGISALKQVTLPASSKSIGISDVEHLVRAVLIEAGLPEDMGDEDNIYAHGMDSLRTTEAISNLRVQLGKYRPASVLSWMSAELLYRNPTAQDLSAVVLEFIRDGKVPQRKDRIQEMKRVIEQSLQRLPAVSTRSQSNSKGGKLTVAITGTTGFLGGRLVQTMIQDPNIEKIYCLNRSPKAEKTFGGRYENATSNRVEFWQIDFIDPTLGLSEADYMRLATDCDVILHNAWRVDFNLALSSFADNIKSLERFIELSAASPSRPRIIFVSSISTTGVWAPKNSLQWTIPATILEDLSHTLDLGYAESKQVSEHVLQAASQSGIPATIVRMGQLCPAVEASDRPWPQDDSMAVYLRTCKSLGQIGHDFVDNVDWIPLDSAANIVHDIVCHDANLGLEMPVYNVVNPHPQPLAHLLPSMIDWGNGMTEVSMEEWVQKVRDRGRSEDGASKLLPALRMMPIYELIAQRGPLHRYDMANLMELSQSLAKVPKIDSPSLKRWLQDL